LPQEDKFSFDNTYDSLQTMKIKTYSPFISIRKYTRKYGGRHFILLPYI